MRSFGGHFGLVYFSFLRSPWHSECRYQKHGYFENLLWRCCFSFCNCSNSLMLAAEVALASSSLLWCFISKWYCSARYCFFSAFWNTCWVFLIIFCLFFSVPRGREKALPSGATSFWNETSKATWRSKGHLSGCHQGTWTATKWKA